MNTKFYAVVVAGPSVVGIPTSELLNLVTLHVDTIKRKIHDDKEDKEKVNGSDLKRAYPNQF